MYTYIYIYLSGKRVRGPRRCELLLETVDLRRLNLEIRVLDLDLRLLGCRFTSAVAAASCCSYCASSDATSVLISKLTSSFDKGLGGTRCDV